MRASIVVDTEMVFVGAIDDGDRLGVGAREGVLNEWPPDLGVGPRGHRVEFVDASLVPLCKPSDHLR